MTLARLAQIYERQDPPAWGSMYQPSIKATREEAPAISCAAEMWSEKLQRYVHALSSPEQKAVLLALFCPQLFELQEQRMLPLGRRPHPLAGHPRAVGLDFPEMRGTIQVAESLDLLRAHSWLRQRDTETDGEQLVPIPFTGDMLLFLADDLGPYCVNWTVKDTEEDFSRSVHLRRRVRNPSGDAQDARARHAIEEQLYFDAGIRTVRVIESTIPDRLECNLRNLLLHQRRRGSGAEHVERELEDRIRASLRTGEAPQAVVLAVVHRHGWQYQDVRQSLYQILWERRVRVEMIDASILMDQSLVPERNDPIQRYAHLFNREVR
ncbi:MAG TPA: hypothetical protein VGM81_07635 [Burkholderiaceae bacterium]|jgi:hypothetical protein